MLVLAYKMKERPRVPTRFTDGCGHSSSSVDSARQTLIVYSSITSVT